MCDILKKLKILEICPYSAGICGVWQRVKQESEELIKKGYDVTIFSSNHTKGSKVIAKEKETINKIKIRRFPARKLIGESFMFWTYEKNAIELEPDIIIVHNYRHLHTTKALSVRNKLKEQGKSCKIFLVTHAPFVKKGTTRTKFEDTIVEIYDSTIGKKTINKFDRIITISDWENNALKKLQVKPDKIIKISNFLPSSFFKEKKIAKYRNRKTLLFLGRITPVKNIEILLDAIKDLDINLKIVGFPEKEYLNKLKLKIQTENIKNVIFEKPIYNLYKKIKLIDSIDIFILPSNRESFGQVIIEALARGKIVISSDTDGGKEIIKDKTNGFLFDIGNSSQLCDKIKLALKMSNSQKTKIKNAAIKTAKEYSAEKSITKLEELFYD